MKWSKFYCCFIVFFLLFFAFSCRKQLDETAPSISLISPEANTILDFNDSIHIIATVSDDEPIKMVRFSLVSENLQPITASYYYYPKTNYASYDFNFQITEAFFESGLYYLQVTASDGINTSNAYLQLQINGAPYLYEGLVFLTRTSAIQVNMLDTLLNSSFLFETAGDYTASILNSKYRKLFIAGREFLNLEVFNIDNFQPEWSVTPDINIPYHTKDCLYSDNDLYITFCRYFFRRYSMDGQIGFTTAVGDMETPGNIINTGNYILVERQGTGLFNSYLGCYYSGTGSLYNQVQIYYEIEGMIPVSEREVALICSGISGNSIKYYDIEERKIFDKFSLPSGGIGFCESTATNNLLCRIGEDVYEINTISGFYTVIQNLEGINLARYEQTNNKLFAVSGDEIRIYNYPTYSLLHTILVSSDVLNIHLLYNR